MHRAKAIGLFISFATSVIIIAFLCLHIDFNLLVDELKRVDVRYFPLLALLFVGVFWIRALRWKLLLPNSETLSVRNLFNANLLGVLTSFILPLRAGEFVRPWVLAKTEDVSFSAGFATVITERMFDVVSLLALFSLCLVYVEGVPNEMVLGAKFLGGFSLFVILIMLVAYKYAEAAAKFSHLVISGLVGRVSSGLSEKLQGMASEFIHGLRAISSFRELIMILVWSAVIWVGSAVFYQLGLWAFDIFPSFWVGMTVNVMIAFAVALPSAPGFLGTFQAGCVIALEVIFGFSSEFAVGYSLILHAVQIVLIYVMGLLILHTMKLSLSTLLHAADKESTPS